MSSWPSIKVKELLKVFLKCGWTIKRSSGSHKVLSHPEHPDYVFAFHDREEIGPRMLARIAKQTGISPEDVRKS